MKLSERVLAGLGVAGMCTAAAAVWYFDPAKASFFPVCPLFKLTGLACPGCGMTRAFHALSHGEFAAALDLNALSPIFAVLIAFFLVSLILVAIRGRGLDIRLLRPNALWAVFILLVVFGVLRNLPVYPFSILFP